MGSVWDERERITPDGKQRGEWEGLSGYYCLRPKQSKTVRFSEITTLRS